MWHLGGTIIFIIHPEVAGSSIDLFAQLLIQLNTRYTTDENMPFLIGNNDSPPLTEETARGQQRLWVEDCELKKAKIGLHCIKHETLTRAGH